MNIRNRQIERAAAEIVRQRVEPLKAACRDIFYESMRQQINAANQPHRAPMIDLVRGNHRLQEVVWPPFK
jgi:hypothetical protein